MKKQSGFTLLELMMSMVIMSIAFLGILPIFFYSQAQIKEATLTNIAISIIEEKMDRIVQLDYDLINYTDFDHAFYPSMPQYTYVLPERYTRPCTSYSPNPCGFVTNSSSPYYHKLLDIVEVNGYYFTRVIDIDQPKIWESLEDEDKTGLGQDNLPADRQTLRVTITVSWTVPGGHQRSVSSTTHIFDAPYGIS
ncbi:type II secretion system protein [bacterium]|nr:type II secretion system protein [candidate division CSSED10-310 bacterium]